MATREKVTHGGFPGEVVVRRGHELRDCERELKASPGYSPFTGTPSLFTCSCGRQFAYHDEESEGASWVLLPSVDAVDVTITKRSA